MKVFVQVELARLAVVERISTLEPLDQVPGPRLRVSWLVWFWVLMYVGLVFQVGGIIGGIVARLRRRWDSRGRRTSFCWPSPFRVRYCW